MNPEVKVTAPEPKYRVISVEKTPAPESMTGIWHRYVIGEGNSRVDGIKCGSMQVVKQHAETVAENLNSRSGTKSFPNYVARNKKRAMQLRSTKTT